MHERMGFVELLKLAGYHAGLLMSAKDYPAGHRGGMGIGEVFVEVEIRAAAPTMASEGSVWDQVYLNGEHCGNRHGGVERLMELYAPVLGMQASYYQCSACDASVNNEDPASTGEIGSMSYCSHTA